jgi:thiol-disulfide isomerase/thioredoxin
MVKREIPTQRYIIAGVITALIFSLGLLLGFIIDIERLQFATQVATVQEINFKSLQLNSILLDEFQSKKELCTVLQVSLEQVLIDLGHSLDKIEEYKTDSSFNKEEYKLILRNYLLDNIRYWMFAIKGKESCNMDLVTVLYFYSEESCPICPSQGTLLSYFKKKYGNDLLVFPINTDIKTEEKVIPILMGIFEVDKFPTIVINDRKFEGLVENEDLGKLICASFKNASKCNP